MPIADHELAELVEADRHEPSPAFLGELDRKVAAGFPKAPRRRRRFALQPWMGLAGAAAAAVVVVAIALPQGGSDSGSQGGGGASQAESAAESMGSAAESSAPPAADAGRQAAPDSAASGPSPSAAPAPSSGSAVAPSSGSSGARKVERSTALTLSTTDDEVQAVSDDVVEVTDRFGGIVQSSSVETGDGQQGVAQFSLRIPAARLDEAIAAYSKLAHVASRSQSAQDITAAYDQAQTRLEDARAERRALLRALNRATDAGRIASLRERLRIVRGRIATLEGRRAAVRRRAELATVALTVEGGADSARDDDGGGAWTPGDALDDAGRVLAVAAGVAIIALAALVPLALLGALAALGARTARRRRRGAALDAL